MSRKLETLTHFGKGTLHKITFFKGDIGNHYTVMFSCNKKHPGCDTNLTEEQYIEFRIWLADQPIRRFNGIVENFCKYYKVGLGWHVNYPTIRNHLELVLWKP